MASSYTYTYNLSDFKSNPTAIIDHAQIEAQLKSSAIQANLISTIKSNNFSFVFSDRALNDAEIAILNQIVSNYVQTIYENIRSITISEKQATGINGGDFIAGDWVTRTLNSTSNIVRWATLNNDNTFTLVPGNYVLICTAPAKGVNYHQIRLFSVTDNKMIGDQANGFSTSDENRVVLQVALAPVVNTTYMIQHRGQKTALSTGLGTATGFDGEEQYTTVNISLV